MDISEDKAIAGLDLEPIKRKLMRSKPGAAWSSGQVDAVEREYRRFLFLMKMFPNELIAPTMEVDRFWHHHILDTVKYARDCQVVFGYFLHHYPYLGLGGEKDEARRQRAGARMRELYREMFGAPEASTDGVTHADTGFAVGVGPTLKSEASARIEPDAEMNLVSYCAAPGRGTSGAAALDTLGIRPTVDQRLTWPSYDETDESGDAGDLLDQIRYVVTENQRYDRVAEPVH